MGNFQGQLQKCDPGQNAQERGQLQVYQKPGDGEEAMMMIQRYDDGTTDMKELINIIMKPLVTMLLPMARLPPYAQYDPEK